MAGGEVEHQFGPTYLPDIAAVERPESTSNSAAMNNTNPRLLIDQPNQTDVLFGRGAPFIRWPGNLQFRRLVNERRADYLATRRHDDKNRIAREIVHEIQSQHRGRFLIKASVADDDFIGFPMHWAVADDQLVVEKVKQTLRDKQIAPSSSSAGGDDFSASNGGEADEAISPRAEKERGKKKRKCAPKPINDHHASSAVAADTKQQRRRTKKRASVAAANLEDDAQKPPPAGGDAEPPHGQPAKLSLGGISGERLSSCSNEDRTAGQPSSKPAAASALPLLPHNSDSSSSYDNNNNGGSEEWPAASSSAAAAMMPPPTRRHIRHSGDVDDNRIGSSDHALLRDLELLSELREAWDLQHRQALLGGSMLLLGQTTSTCPPHHPWTSRVAVAAGSPAQRLHDLIQMQSQQQQQQQQLGFDRTGAGLYYPTAAAATTDQLHPHQLLETLGGLGGGSSRSQGFISDPPFVSSSSSSYLLEQQQEQERSEFRRKMLLHNEILQRQLVQQQQQRQGGVMAQDPHHWMRMERPFSIVAAGLLGQEPDEDDTIVQSQEGRNSRGGQK